MAALRYEKCGLVRRFPAPFCRILRVVEQKPLAQHCLSQAAEIYTHELDSSMQDSDKPLNVAEHAQQSWSSIEGYIHQGLGRQAYHLGKSEEAIEHFLALLSHAAGEESDEGDEGAWDDFRLAYQVSPHSILFSARLISFHDAELGRRD